MLMICATRNSGPCAGFRRRGRAVPSRGRIIGEPRPLVVGSRSRMSIPDRPPVADEEPSPMAHDETNRTDRRSFLQAGALGTAAGMSLSPDLKAQDAAEKGQEGGAKAATSVLPRRKLGKTGVEITM